jgi:hypothetical protein
MYNEIVVESNDMIMEELDENFSSDNPFDLSYWSSKNAEAYGLE